MLPLLLQVAWLMAGADLVEQVRSANSPTLFSRCTHIKMMPRHPHLDQPQEAVDLRVGRHIAVGPGVTSLGGGGGLVTRAACRCGVARAARDDHTERMEG